MTFVPIRKVNMKTIAWAVAAARVEFMFIGFPWPRVGWFGFGGWWCTSTVVPIFQVKRLRFVFCLGCVGVLLCGAKQAA